MTAAEKNAAVAAPPRPFALAGRTLLLAAPTISDALAISTECRRLLAGQETPLGELVADPAFAKLPPACQVAACQRATDKQLAKSISGMDQAFELARPPLLSFAIWLLAHPHHPELTLAEVRALLTEESAGEASVRFIRASGMADLEKNALAGLSG